MKPPLRITVYDGSHISISQWKAWRLSKRTATELAYSLCDYLVEMRNTKTKKRKR